jgi:hypothetical protein
MRCVKQVRTLLSLKLTHCFTMKDKQILLNLFKNINIYFVKEILA